MYGIREEYDRVKSALTIVAPFISSLLSRVRIVISGEVETAGVTESGVMVISPTFWSKLSWSGKAFILAHETMHIAFRDHKRMANRDVRAWNYVADAVNNDLIEEFLNVPDEVRKFIVFTGEIWHALEEYLSRKISYENFKRLSKEEIYRLLPRISKTKGVYGVIQCPSCGGRNIKVRRVSVNGKVDFTCRNCGREWSEDIEVSDDGTPIPIKEVEIDIGLGDVAGEVLQEGDPEIYRDGKEGDDEDEKWKEKIALAYDVQKSIGKVPAGLKRIVDEILKPKVDWRSLLKQAFRIGFGRTVVSTWRKPSRKCPEYPGLRRYTYPQVWVLVDVSGSIGKSEVEQFISEVYAIAGDTQVNVVVWDAKVYDVIEARNQFEVISKVKESLRGGGGTVIHDALKTTLERMRYNDIVVILSDMDVYDLDEPETLMLFSDVASKSSVAVICSTDREVDIEGWRFIRLEIN